MLDREAGAVILDGPERERAAARLGVERRRLFLISTVVGLAAPVLPYLSGAWETAWFALAATPLPLPIRTLIFLVGMHLALALVMLPLGYYGGYVLQREYGLGRQTRVAWALDWLKATLLGLVLGSAVGGVFVWTVTSSGANWWWVFGLFVSGVGLALVFLTPYVLVPLFFKMRPLADVETAERIHALGQRAGAPVRDVCSLDFSRRTAEANAAVIGIGRSRRVVIADTLLAEFSAGEVDAVVAHELGHHIHRDVQRLLLGNAAAIWLGLFAASRVAPLALPVLSLPSLAYVPGYPMLLFVVEVYFLVLGPLLSWWSRRLETAADRFSLELTRDPAAFAAAMRRIGCQNLIELRPPRWAEVLLASHPALYRRIQLAESLSPPARFHTAQPKDEASRGPSRRPSHDAEKRHAEVTISGSSSINGSVGER